MKQLPQWIGHVFAAILSIGAGFFGVLNALFSDIFGVRAQVAAMAYVFFVYLITSAVLFWFWPRQQRAWVLWTLIPGGLFGLSMTISDFSRIIYPLGILGAMVLGVWVSRGVVRSIRK